MAGEGMPVRLASRVLRVSESGYYRWRQRPASARTLRHAWLTEVIVAVHSASLGVYGARSVHAELTLGHGITVSRGTVELLMRRAGLRGLPGNASRSPRRTLPTAACPGEHEVARHTRDHLWATDIAGYTTDEGTTSTMTMP